MQTLAFIEMPKILKASENKKYRVYQDELIKTVDRILMAKLGGKKSLFACLLCAGTSPPMNLQVN